MTNHEKFLQAIHNKRILQVEFDSYEKWIIVRHCIPFDFWPSRRKNLKENPDRYHFYDLDSPEQKHNLSIIPEQLIELSVTEDDFDPATYIKRTPNRFVERDWWEYS